MSADLHPLLESHGVLVIEPEREPRRQALDLLRQLGLKRVYGAVGGHVALTLSAGLAQTPAVVMLDLEMPGMDGIELIQRLARSGQRPALIVASSADPGILGTLETMIETLGLPFLDIVRKPLVREELQAALHRFRPPAPPRILDPRAARITLPMTPREIVTALDAQRFTPHYQPKIALDSTALVGLEALARCSGPDGQTLPPSCFIDVAEQHGLIQRLTLAMLDAVLRDLASWQSTGFRPKIALNVSARSLSDAAFAGEVLRRTERAGISPSDLVLEITESALVSDLATALGTLGRLRLKGVGLSIDDYGTGFSSMQQLLRLPFTELKIDRSFIRNAHSRWNLRAVLESTIQIGHRLGLATVAEGIETSEELELLASLGCQSAQGFLIAPPLPATHVKHWMSRRLGRALTEARQPAWPA